MGTEAEGKRVLIVCATRHESTIAIADAVAEELRGAGCQAEVRRAADAGPPEGFDAAVVGGPMIFGWHKDAMRWIKAQREALASLPVAYFITAASLTQDGADAVEGVPVVKDSWLVKAPKRPGKLRYRERYALPSHYLGDVLKKTAPVRPRQAAFFAGSTDLTTMNLFEKAFVLLVIGATPGDGRHFDAVREWARELPAVLFSEE